MIIKNLYFISFLVEVSGQWLKKKHENETTAFQNAQRA